MTVLHILSVLLGLLVVGEIIGSALKTVVLPRHGFTRIARFVFAVVHRIFVHPRIGRAARENELAMFAPTALVSLPLVWMLSVTVGFAFIFWGVDSGTWPKSIEISGSSLFTLGFSEPHGAGRTWISFVAATVGLGLVALLISYLPTIYGAYNAREKGINVFRPFAGRPPSATALLANLQRAGALDNPNFWSEVWDWLIDLEQSHTSFPALAYFPMQSEGQSWVASVGTVLDASSLMLAGMGFAEDLSLRGPTLTLAYGVPALSRIARASRLPVPDAKLLAQLVAHLDEEPPAISVRQGEFDEAVTALEASGVLSGVEREAAWRGFCWVRSGYDEALRGLAGLTGADPAPWSTDRPASVGRPRIFGNHTLKVDWALDAPASTS